MKKLIAALCLVSNIAYASGDIVFAPALHTGNAKFESALGLDVSQYLFLGVSYQSWTGLALYPNRTASSELAFHTTHDLFWQGEKYGAGIGFTWGVGRGDSEALRGDSDVHLILSYRLWE